MLRRPDLPFPASLTRHATAWMATLRGPNLLPAMLAGVAAIALAAELVRLPARTQGLRHPPVASVASAPAPSLLPSVAALAGLFGQAPVAVAPVETASSLVLTAVIATPDPTRGFAILGPTAARTAVYQVGAEVSGGLRLVEVYADRAVLEGAGGARQILKLPHTEIAGISTAQLVEPVRQGKAGRPAPTDEQSVVVQKAPEKIQEAVSYERQMLKQTDPVGEIYAAQRTERGYQLNPGRDPARYAALGVQPGDVVVAINGVDLSDDDQAHKLLYMLGHGQLNNSVLTVQRAGGIASVAVGEVAPPPPTKGH